MAAKAPVIRPRVITGTRPSIMPKGAQPVSASAALASSGAKAGPSMAPSAGPRPASLPVGSPRPAYGRLRVPQAPVAHTDPEEDEEPDGDHCDLDDLAADPDDADEFEEEKPQAAPAAPPKVLMARPKFVPAAAKTKGSPKPSPAVAKPPLMIPPKAAVGMKGKGKMLAPVRQAVEEDEDVDMAPPPGARPPVSPPPPKAAVGLKGKGKMLTPVRQAVEEDADVDMSPPPKFGGKLPNLKGILKGRGKQQQQAPPEEPEEDDMDDDDDDGNAGPPPPWSLGGSKGKGTAGKQQPASGEAAGFSVLFNNKGGSGGKAKAAQPPKTPPPAKAKPGAPTPAADEDSSEDEWGGWGADGTKKDVPETQQMAMPKGKGRKGKGKSQPVFSGPANPAKAKAPPNKAAGALGTMAKLAALRAMGKKKQDGGDDMDVDSKAAAGGKRPGDDDDDVPVTNAPWRTGAKAPPQAVEATTGKAGKAGGSLLTPKVVPKLLAPKVAPKMVAPKFGKGKSKQAQEDDADGEVKAEATTGKAGAVAQAKGKGKMLPPPAQKEAEDDDDDWGGWEAPEAKAEETKPKAPVAAVATSWKGQSSSGWGSADSWEAASQSWDAKADDWGASSWDGAASGKAATPPAKAPPASLGPPPLRPGDYGIPGKGASKGLNAGKQAPQAEGDDAAILATAGAKSAPGSLGSVAAKAVGLDAVAPKGPPPKFGMPVKGFGKGVDPMKRAREAEGDDQANEAAEDDANGAKALRTASGKAHTTVPPPAKGGIVPAKFKTIPPPAKGGKGVVAAAQSPEAGAQKTTAWGAAIPNWGAAAAQSQETGAQKTPAWGAAAAQGQAAGAQNAASWGAAAAQGQEAGAQKRPTWETPGANDESKKMRWSEEEKTAPQESVQAVARTLEAGRYLGRVKSFNVEKGFGFLESAETHAEFGVDVFIHSNCIGTSKVGDNVTFAIQKNAQGKPQAKDVKPDPPPSGAAEAPSDGKDWWKDDGKDWKASSEKSEEKDWSQKSWDEPAKKDEKAWEKSEPWKKDDKAWDKNDQDKKDDKAWEKNDPWKTDDKAWEKNDQAKSSTWGAQDNQKSTDTGASTASASETKKPVLAGDLGGSLLDQLEGNDAKATTAQAASGQAWDSSSWSASSKKDDGKDWKASAEKSDAKDAWSQKSWDEPAKKDDKAWEKSDPWKKDDKAWEKNDQDKKDDKAWEKNDPWKTDDKAWEKNDQGKSSTWGAQDNQKSTDTGASTASASETKKPEPAADLGGSLVDALEGNDAKATTTQARPSLVTFVDELVRKTPSAAVKLDAAPGSREAFLHRLPLTGVTNAQVEEWLGGYGATEQVNVLHDPVTGERTGCAYVRFKDTSSAEKILASYVPGAGTAESVEAWWSISERLESPAGAQTLSSRVEPLAKQLKTLDKIAVLGGGCKADPQLRDIITDSEKGQLKVAAWLSKSDPGSMAALKQMLGKTIAATVSALGGEGSTPAAAGTKGGAGQSAEQQWGKGAQSWNQQAQGNQAVNQPGPKAVNNGAVGGDKGAGKAASVSSTADVASGPRSRHTVFIDELPNPKRPELPGSETDREVFLQKLPTDHYTEEQLREWFKDFGTITDLRLMKDPTGKYTGDCYMRFERHEEAAAWIGTQEEGGVTASWSESERLLQGAQNVYRTDAHPALKQAVSRITKQQHLGPFILSEASGSQAFAPAPLGSQLHFTVECTNDEFTAIRKYLADVLAEFHGGPPAEPPAAPPPAAATAAVQAQPPAASQGTAQQWGQGNAAAQNQAAAAQQYGNANASAAKARSGGYGGAVASSWGAQVQRPEAAAAGQMNGGCQGAQQNWNAAAPQQQMMQQQQAVQQQPLQQQAAQQFTPQQQMLMQQMQGQMQQSMFQMPQQQWGGQGW